MTLAAGTEALIAVVPRGAEHFRVHFTANDDLDTKLRTHDSPNSYCVAGYGCKLGSGRQACPSIVASELVDYAPTNGCNTADHEGMTITFSGDDVVGPVREMIYISTTVTRTLYYRVHAFRSATFTATWDFGDFPSTAEMPCDQAGMVGVAPSPPPMPSPPPSPPQGPPPPLHDRRHLTHTGPARWR